MDTKLKKLEGENKMKEIVLKVEGMVCSGCENRVQNALSNLEFVKKVVADHKTNTVKIMFDQEGLEKEIKETIEDLGFDVVEEE